MKEFVLRSPVFVLLLCILGYAFIGCKQEAKSADIEEITNQQSTSGDHALWSFLTHLRFHNRNTVMSGQNYSQNPNAGHWIDFRDDGTYEYGVLDKRTLTGKWEYDHPAGLLDLIPDDASKPSQWRVMHNDDILVLVGTAKYGDNATQAQWMRHEGFPGVHDDHFGEHDHD